MASLLTAATRSGLHLLGQSTCWLAVKGDKDGTSYATSKKSLFHWSTRRPMDPAADVRNVRVMEAPWVDPALAQ